MVRPAADRPTAGRRRARELALKDRVPVVVEAILERVTNISMGTALDAVNEFEPIAEDPAVDAPTAIALRAGAGPS